MSAEIWRSACWPLRVMHDAGCYELEQRVAWPGMAEQWCHIWRSRSGIEIRHRAEVEEARLAARDAIRRLSPPLEVTLRSQLYYLEDAIDELAPESIVRSLENLEICSSEREWLRSEIDPLLRLVEHHQRAMEPTE